MLAIGPDLERATVRASTHHSPFIGGRGSVALGLHDELESEHVGESKEAIQRQLVGVSFERGEPSLADAKLGGQLPLRYPTRFASPTKDLCNLVRCGDDLLHGDHYLPSE